MHVPVMEREALEQLQVQSGGIYLEATTGLGGHTARIAERLTTGTIIACDRDPLSLEMAKRNLEPWADRIIFRRGDFASIAETVRQTIAFGRLSAEPPLNGILADLGVSRYQLTDPQRGFSFTADGPLDMRMDPTMGMTAADLVNQSDETTLADLIYQLGEERRARRVARAIVRARPIRSTLHLADVVSRAVPRTGRLHPATRTFMALRLAVNNEMGQLDRLLQIGPDLLKPGGRMVVISFMSLEDRRVKHRFRELENQGRAIVLTKRPLQPSEEEVRDNPPSRSAKLRAIEMKSK